jgi:hypothetical protein
MGLILAASGPADVYPHNETEDDPPSASAGYSFSSELLSSTRSAKFALMWEGHYLSPLDRLLLSGENRISFPKPSCPV